MFLDIKLGLLWSVIVSLVFQEPLTPLWFCLGVLFALLPDIDFWIEYAMRGTVGGKTLGAHRTLLHNPLTYIPVALGVGAFFGPAWMTLFTLGVMGHFIHDSMGMGFGVRWLWPFSPNWYKFFSTCEGDIRYNMQNFFVSWTPTEMDHVISEKGNDNWLNVELSYIRTHIGAIAAQLLLLVLAIVLVIQILDYLA